AHVATVVLVQRIEQAADAGGVDLDADVVAFAIPRGCEAQRLAVAEADFQHAFRVTAEHRVEIARPADEVQPEARPQRVERALLRRGEPPLPQHEAAHAAPAFLDGERFRRGLGAVAGERIGHRFQLVAPLTPPWPSAPIEGGAAGAAMAAMAGTGASATAAPAAQVIRSIPRRETTRWRSACAGCARRETPRARPRSPASSHGPSARGPSRPRDR